MTRARILASFTFAAGLGLSATMAQSHSYEVCFQSLAMDCQFGQDDDPLNICEAQVMAYCSNHQHGGGGGVQPFGEPVFAIEERDDLLIMTHEIDLRTLDRGQRTYLKGLIESRMDASSAAAKRRMLKFRMLDSREE